MLRLLLQLVTHLGSNLPSLKTVDDAFVQDELMQVQLSEVLKTGSRPWDLGLFLRRLSPRGSLPTQPENARIITSIVQKYLTEAGVGTPDVALLHLLFAKVSHNAFTLVHEWDEIGTGLFYFASFFNHA